MSKVRMNDGVAKEIERIKEGICENKTYEVCPYCKKEVELEAKVEIQECPECSKDIKPCSLCINCIEPCIYDEILECRNCNVEGTWEGGTDSNGNLYQCDGCGEIHCLSCLEKEGEIDQYVLCPECLNQLKDINLDEDFEEVLEKFGKIKHMDALMKEVGDDNIRVFEDIDAYLDWMYDSADAKAGVFDYIIHYKRDDIPEGKSIIEYLIDCDDRVLTLRDGKIFFHFD